MRIIVLLLFQLYFTESRAEQFSETVPTHLYHWTTVSGLNKFSENSKNKWPNSFKIPKSNTLRWFSEYSGRKKQGGLYAFRNTTAVAGGFREFYGNVLIKIKIDVSKVILFVGPSNAQDLIQITNSLSAKILAQKANLVYFPFFNEWVVLDPSIIQDVIADPLALSLDVKSELVRLKSDITYDLEDLHYPYEIDEHPFIFKYQSQSPSNLQSRNRRNFTVFILENYLALPRASIPPIYLLSDLNIYDQNVSPREWQKNQTNRLQFEELRAYADPNMLQTILDLHGETKINILIKILELGSRKTRVKRNIDFLRQKLHKVNIEIFMLLEISSEFLNPKRGLHSLFEDFFDIETSSLLKNQYSDNNYRFDNSFICSRFLN